VKALTKELRARRRPTVKPAVGDKGSRAVKTVVRGASSGAVKSTVGYITDHPVEKWYRDAKLYTIFEGTSEIQRIVLSQALAAAEGAPPLHVEIEPSGGPLNRMFGRGTVLRARVASAALFVQDRIPEPLMRVAMQVLRPTRK
jgi:hypothetical protein